MKRLLKAPALTVLMLLLAGTAVACSSDSDSDDVSPEEAYCDAGDSLKTSVESLLDLDVIAEGTNGVEAAIEDTQASMDEFTDAAKEVTEDDAQALEAAFNDLKAAFDSISDDGITAENGSAVVDALTAMAAPADAVFATLTETC